MLDVHPPEHTPHTWRDFFIHIATIVIGLLIAVALEQTVEAIHHHHQAHHARQMLARESGENREHLRQAVYILNMHENYLFADLAVLGRLRTHTLQPQDIVVVWHPHPLFTDSAWRTIQESQVAALLSYDELQQYGAIYILQDGFNTDEKHDADTLMQAATVIYRGAADRFDPAQARKAAPAGAAIGLAGDKLAHAAFEDEAPNAQQLQRLTPDEQDRLQQAIQETIYADESLLARCALLQSKYAALPPD